MLHGAIRAAELAAFGLRAEKGVFRVGCIAAHAAGQVPFLVHKVDGYVHTVRVDSLVEGDCAEVERIDVRVAVFVGIFFDSFLFFCFFFYFSF
jgi:hypothetical protein